jgi:hypothetical protein
LRNFTALLFSYLEVEMFLFVAATSIIARLAALVVQDQAQAVASLQGHVLVLCVQMLHYVVVLVELEEQLEGVVPQE